MHLLTLLMATALAEDSAPRAQLFPKEERPYYVGPRLPTAAERPLQTYGLGLQRLGGAISEPTWSPIPYGASLYGLAFTSETLAEPKISRFSLFFGRGSTARADPTTSLTTTALRVESLTATALRPAQPWTVHLGFGANLEGEVREGAQDSFDAWALCELAAATRWIPPSAEGRWVLDASLKLPVLGAGLRPWEELPIRPEGGEVDRYNLSVVSWHNHASVQGALRATRLLSNGNALYASASARGRWSWGEPAFARASAGLEVGVLWAQGMWR